MCGRAGFLLQSTPLARPVPDKVWIDQIGLQAHGVESGPVLARTRRWIVGIELPAWFKTCKLRVTRKGARAAWAMGFRVWSVTLI
jgi:hypothetical protein